MLSPLPFSTPPLSNLTYTLTNVLGVITFLRWQNWGSNWLTSLKFTQFLSSRGRMWMEPDAEARLFATTLPSLPGSRFKPAAQFSLIPLLRSQGKALLLQNVEFSFPLGKKPPSGLPEVEEYYSLAWKENTQLPPPPESCRRTKQVILCHMLTTVRGGPCGTLCMDRKTTLKLCLYWHF